jgi:hypothetical protein
MAVRKVYEYLIVDDFFGDLEKGTRLYYDYNKLGYTYHYEYEGTDNNSRYQSSESSVADYYINLDSADRYIYSGELVPGPELGEYEPVTI